VTTKNLLFENFIV